MQRLLTDWQWSPMSVRECVSVKTKLTPHPDIYRGNTQSYQLGIKFTGHSELRYKGTSIDFTAGSVAYLPKEDTTRIDYTGITIESGTGVCIFFDSALPLPKQPQYLKKVDAEVEHAFLKMLRVYSRSDQYAYPDIMAAFYDLLAKINRMNTAQSRKNAETRYKPALAYIQEHWNHEFIDFNQAAVLCGMSEKYFRDSFKAALNITPLQYFHQQKMLHIRTLISDLSLSIADVAYRSGFSSSNYFSRFFKKAFGVSPTEYRKYYCKNI